MRIDAVSHCKAAMLTCLRPCRATCVAVVRVKGFEPTPTLARLLTLSSELGPLWTSPSLLAGVAGAPHQLGYAIDKRPLPLLTLTKRSFRALAVGDVAEERCHPVLFTVDREYIQVENAGQRLLLFLNADRFTAVQRPPVQLGPAWIELAEQLG